MRELEQVAVTPPGADTPSIRHWIMGEAERQGWTHLRWEEGYDDAGRPMARLKGVRPHEEEGA